MVDYNFCTFISHRAEKSETAIQRSDTTLNAFTTLETRICIPLSSLFEQAGFYRLLRESPGGSDLGSPKCESEALKSDALSGTGRHDRRLRALHQHKLAKMNASEAHAYFLVDSRSLVFAELFNSVSFLRTFIRVLRLMRDAML